MKSIVISCKTITEDIENYENSTDLRNDDRDHLDDLKNYLSEALTTLMTAAKSYATSQGKTPVPDLEDSLLSLTDTVVDLIRSSKEISCNGDVPPPRKESFRKRDRDRERGRGKSSAKTVPELKVFFFLIKIRLI